MPGKFTRKMYDGCATQQDTKQSTDPLELVMDVTKYVHCNNICQPSEQYPPNAALLVDVESSLWGIDKTSSKCVTEQHPMCGPNCLLTKDSRIPPYRNPLSCSWAHDGENGVVTTNMKPENDPGYRLPDPKICEKQGNGYYADPRRVPKRQVQRQPLFAPLMGAPRTRPVQQAPTANY